MKKQEQVNNIHEDIEELSDYVSTRKLGSYIILAVDELENDYFIAWNYRNYPDHIITLLEYTIEELNDSRPLDS